VSEQVAVGYARLVCEVAVERYGCALPELLESAGLSPDRLEDPDATIPMPCLIGMTRALLERTRDPALGLRMAEAFDLRRQGFWGYALLSSETMAERVSRLLRYQTLRGMTRLSLRREGAFAIADLVPIGIPDDLIPIFFDFGVAATSVHHRELVDAPNTEIRVWLSYSEKPHHEQLRHVVRGPVVFDAPFNRMQFQAEHLDVIRGGDRYLSEIATAELEARLSHSARPSEPALLMHLRARLVDQLAGDPSLVGVARELGVGARTLQRQLNALGLSFQDELEGIRRARALELLRETTSTIERVAAAVGYRDPSNFRRAFRRWMGISPTAFRAGVLARDSRHGPSAHPASQFGGDPVARRH
jgi:AraC-like DNA-binding protein